MQAREVDARVTADALVEATRAAEDRATRAERAAALAERDIGFLKALNVRFPRQILHPIRADYVIGELCERGSSTGYCQR